MKIISLLLMIFISGNIFSQDKCLNETRKFIYETIELVENNPIHKIESDSINHILKTSLDEHFTKEDLEIRKAKVSNIFMILYQNGNSIYEDTQEERRMKLRRGICCASIALLSNPEISNTFLEQSKLSIAGNLNKPNIELLEEPYLGLLLLNVMLQYESKQLTKADIDEVRDFIKTHKVNLSDNHISKSETIISCFSQTLNSVGNSKTK